jgi:hypothetical protein
MSWASVRVFLWLLPIGALTVVPLVPARADFFDDARKTFKTDIPRFFQHDIPCAFGGKPAGNNSCHQAQRGGSPRHSHQAAMHKVVHQQDRRVVRSFRDASGQPCRVVNETVLIDGEKTRATGTVCKQSDGRWTIPGTDTDMAAQPNRLGALDATGQATP